MKKLLALAVSLTLALSLSATAFAVGADASSNSNGEDDDFLQTLFEAVQNGDDEAIDRLIKESEAKSNAAKAEREAADEAARAAQEAREAENFKNIAGIKVSDWAKGTVNSMTGYGHVPTGLGTDYTVPITRAQFCALAVEAYESGYIPQGEITTRSYFDDTNDINVQKLASIGVVTGYGDGKFGPNDLITREQAATMLARLRKAISPDYVEASGLTMTFTDAKNSWAVDDIQYIYDNGIMNGYSDTTFGCKDNYTIQQSIITMERLMSSTVPY